MLLCYLTLEGPQERSHLAELFWPGAASGLARLSTTLHRIRREAPDAVGADDVRVWSHVQADVQDLLASVRRTKQSWDLSLYRGPLLAGVALPSWGPELEEWVYATRERVAGQVRQALLLLAGESAAASDFNGAARYAEEAYLLPGASEPEPEELNQFYALLIAGSSPYAPRVREQARDYSIDLSLSAAEARAQLRSIFVGRHLELDRVAALRFGQWAWVRGGVGIGKTSLLQRLAARYVPARSGLPYATLEPLIGNVTGRGEDAILRHLYKSEGAVCFDDWEQMDPESQALLTRLRALKPPIKVVVGSKIAPPFAVDVQLDLSPLPREALEAHSKVWESTRGIPTLVRAHLCGESLSEALGTCLGALSEQAKRVYFSLALLEVPDPGLVRRALGLSAEDMAAALEVLYSAGLVSASGQIWPRQLAREQLENRPALLSSLALRLARMHSGKDAFLLFQTSKLLWEEGDMPAVQRAYLAWADEVLRRGFPKRATEVLDEIPAGEEVKILKARALERIGSYREAFDVLQSLEDSPKVVILRALLHWRLGDPETAYREASKAQKSTDLEVRAEALSLLGDLEWSYGDYEKAESFFRRTAALWRIAGHYEQSARALINVASSQIEGNVPAERVDKTLIEAQRAAEGVPELFLTILLNRAVAYERHGEPERAVKQLKEVITEAEEIGQTDIAALAWSNLGALLHKEGGMAEAEKAYEKALGLARRTGDRQLLGMTIANLAELTGDREAWEEGVQMLEQGGFTSLAERFKEDTFGQSFVSQASRE